MKKKKEFFRIRKDRKRKNGANARACVYVYSDRLPLFRQERREPNQRPRAVDRFFIPTRVLFSKHNRLCLGKPLFCFRVSEPTVFCFLNRSRAEALTRARACVYVHRTHPPPTPKNSRERRVCPFQALQGTYKPFYGRDR